MATWYQNCWGSTIFRVKFTKVKYSLVCISVLLLLAGNIHAKDKPRELVKRGEELYYERNFAEALRLFKRADSLSNDLNIAYWIGITMMEIPGMEFEAMPYFERALEMRNPPYEIHRFLGKIYHQTFHLDKALTQFNLYLAKAPSNDGFRLYAERMLEVIVNAKRVTGIPVTKSIRALPGNINKGYAEYAPYISADMQFMVFIRLEYDKNQLRKTLMSSVSFDGELWQDPKEIIIPDKISIEHIEIAGISQDGSTLYLTIGNGSNNNLYSARLQENKLTDITLLPGLINSRFGEYAISFSADGTYCIFSSSRPGGYGGIDLYRSDLTSDGQWGAPINLGPTINTKYNENFPFLHPDEKRLIFASEGHSSIGGYDLFETELNQSGLWNQPRPISYTNTVYDDRYFMMDAQGTRAIFSQTMNYFPGRTKIFITDLKENIPLTMVKGLILAGNPPKPHKAQIKVFDHLTKQRIKYAYSPDAYTGRYLMIFPPDRNYDILIEAEGFLPQLVNVYIPEQKYFYELYQEITLENIEINSKKIGENVKVRNSFYDISSLALTDSAYLDLVQWKNYDHLLQIIGDIISQTDSLGVIGLDKMTTSQSPAAKEYSPLLDLIGKAIETTDSVSLALIDHNTQYDEVAVLPIYFANKEKNDLLKKQVYGNDTIVIASIIPTSAQRVPVPEVTNSEYALLLRKTKPSELNYVYTDVVYFNLNDINILFEYYKVILNIAEILINNPRLGVELHGYTDPIGKEAYNLNLSERRARSVQRHLTGLGVPSSRILVFPHGIDKNAVQNITDYSKYRRVEIKIFEVRK